MSLFKRATARRSPGAGNKSGNPKMTADDARVIRSIYWELRPSTEAMSLTTLIADEFGVSTSTVRRVIARLSWRQA